VIECCLFAAMANLDKLKLWGKQIKVTPSKHTVVQMPKEGQPVSLSQSNSAERVLAELLLED